MKRLLIPLLAALALPTPALASWNYDLKVGDCIETKVDNLTARWGSHNYKYGLEDPIIEFDNDISLYPYSARLDKNGELANYGRVHLEVVKHVFWGRPDVTLCLLKIPKKCREASVSKNMPKGDLRGDLFSIKNKETGEIMYARNSRNGCGGA